jgi:hypothetical protein
VRAGSGLNQGALSACLLVLTIIGAGCSGSKVTTKSSAELSRYPIRSMVLVPFASMATPQLRDQGDLALSTPQGIRRSDMSVSEPRSADSALRQTTTVPPYASEKITELFWSRLQKRAGLRVLRGGVETAKRSSADSPPARPEAIAANVAKQLKVDAAMLGEVSVYQERVGSRLGASPPAGVGFEVKVVAADGQVLWVGNYYERQRPMIEDMLGFLQRWGAFVTADELARYGVEEVLERFPFGEEGTQ